MENALAFLGTGFSLGGLVLTIFWKGEEALSPALKKWLARTLKGTVVATPKTEWSQILGHVFDRIFGVDALKARFIIMAFLTSFLSVIFFFITYVLRYPFFGESLIDDPYQRTIVIKQIFTTALLVNFVVDYLCLAYCREVIAQMERSPKPTRIPIYLLKDLGMKVGIFTLALGFVYMSFSSGGSFGGSIQNALIAVPETLWGGLMYENLSCIYIYSSLLSSFWLWGYFLSWLGFGLAVRAPIIINTIKWALPIDEHPVRSLGVMTSSILTLAYFVAAGLTQLTSY